MTNTLLIVDDDAALCCILDRAMTKRGFTPEIATSCADARRAIQEKKFDYAVVDYRLVDGDGIEIINALHDIYPDCKVVMLSGYANLPSAVAAIKAGAIDCMPKPCDADDLASVLLAREGIAPSLPQRSINANTIRMAHIINTFKQLDGNVSETARRLGMHRRTLQRILAKSKISVDTPLEEVIGPTNKDIIG